MSDDLPPITEDAVQQAMQKLREFERYRELQDLPLRLLALVQLLEQRRPAKRQRKLPKQRRRRLHRERMR